MKSLIFLILFFGSVLLFRYPEKQYVVNYEKENTKNYTSDTHIESNHNSQNMPANVISHKKTTYTPSSKIDGLICSYFGDENCATAVAIAKAESGLRCEAIGDGHLDPKSYGIFQIRGFTTRPPVVDLLDCEKNIAYAKQMYDRQGWGPWSAYTSGIYLKHL